MNIDPKNYYFQPLEEKNINKKNSIAVRIYASLGYAVG